MKLLTKKSVTKQYGLVLVLLAASGSLSAAEIANNNITEAEQDAKLRFVVDIANEIWGTPNN